MAIWKGSLWLLVLFPLAVAVSWAAAGQGRITWQANDEVEADIVRGHQLPGFSYYYSGSAASPHTIIAVSQAVPFEQSLWQEAQGGSGQLRAWAEAIDNPHRPVQDRYFGGRLLDGQGGLVAIWYSRYRFSSGRVGSNGKLVIMPPVRQDMKGIRQGIF